jgi:23S rRNA (uridine2552-2'-O)-methyltransferase
MSQKKSGKSGKSGKASSSGTREIKVRVKTAKGRKISSKLWLERQLNDPFVSRAKREGYRSRAVYKLTEIDDKFRFLKKGAVVVDLGAAPGSWSQVALERVMPGGKVIGIDLQHIAPLPGATFIEGDFLENEPFEELMQLMEGKKANVVLSDMAAAACGHTQTDHLRIMSLCEAAADFAFSVLEKNGVFLAKVLRGGAERELLDKLKQHFASIKHIKPSASRADSSEMYVLGQGFKG